MALAEKKCVPCEGGVSPLSESQAERLLVNVPGWEIKDGKLVNKFKFKNWAKAFDFVSRINDIAETEQHHPDVAFGWGYAKVSLHTHAINGLHENDFIVAAKISEAA